MPQPKLPPDALIPPAATLSRPPAEPASKDIRRLRLREPWQWLWRGARDLVGSKAIGVFYGICFWLMALVLGAVFRSRPEYVMSVASGCLLLGPFLAMGLYEVSRRRELGLAPELAASLTC